MKVEICPFCHCRTAFPAESANMDLLFICGTIKKYHPSEGKRIPFYSHKRSPECKTIEEYNIKEFNATGISNLDNILKVAKK